MWHTDGVPAGTPANARWWSWAKLASFQASSTIEYLWLDNIGQGVFVNTIASMNYFVTSKVASWCWGICWSALALGCRTFWYPLGFGCGSTCADGARSDLDGLLKRADFWRLSSGGAIDPGGFRGFGSRGRAITVSAWLRFFGNGTLVVCDDLSRRVWPRSRMCPWWSKSSSSMSDDNVVSPVS